MRRLALWVVNNARWVIVGAVVFVICRRDPRARRREPAVGRRLREPELGVGRARAKDLLAGFPAAGEPDFVVLVTARDGTVDDPAVVAAGPRLTERLARDPAVIEAGSYWSLSNAPPLKSTDGREALVIGTLRGGLGERVETAERLSPELTTRHAVDHHRGHRPVRGRPPGERALGEGPATRGAHLDRTDHRRSRSCSCSASMVAAGLPLAIGVARGRRAPCSCCTSSRRSPRSRSSP